MRGFIYDVLFFVTKGIIHHFIHSRIAGFYFVAVKERRIEKRLYMHTSKSKMVFFQKRI